MLGKTVDYSFPVDDFADLYLKGLLADLGNVNALPGDVTVSGDSGDVDLTFSSDAILAIAHGAGATEGEGGVLQLTSGAQSLLVEINGGTIKLAQVAKGATGGAAGKGIVLKKLSNARSGRRMVLPH